MSNSITPAELAAIRERYIKPDDWDQYNQVGKINLLSSWGKSSLSTVPRLCDEVERLQAAQALRMWLVEDDAEGRTWVIAPSEGEALLAFFHSDDDSFAEYTCDQLEITEVDPAKTITMEREECDGGPQTLTAVEWCAKAEGPGVLCSTWWAL